MLAKDVKLYPYRVFTDGGHVHQCWVPFEHSYDLWDTICDLKNGANTTLEGCYFAANGEVIMLFIDTTKISSIDTPFDRGDPRTIQIHEERAQATRTRHMRKRQEESKNNLFNAGQSVQKKRRG